MTTLVEPYCGTAALSYHYLGIGPLLPYQGGKARWAKRIAEVVASLGVPTPDRFLLGDLNVEWPLTHCLLASAEDRRRVLVQLRALVDLDPRAVYDRLMAGRRPDWPEGKIERAAQFLWLQRHAWQGKPVSSNAYGWESPGFNVTSAYGTPVPQGPSLVRRLERWPAGDLPIDTFVGHLGDYLGPFGPGGLDDLAVWYLDPPYAGTTDYAVTSGQAWAGMTPERLARQAAGLLARPSTLAVVVSEGVPLAEAWGGPWTSIRLGQRSTRLAKGASTPGAEWVTVARGPAAA